MSKQLAEVFIRAAKAHSDSPPDLAAATESPQHLSLPDLLRLHGEASAAVLLLLIAVGRLLRPPVELEAALRRSDSTRILLMALFGALLGLILILAPGRVARSRARSQPWRWPSPHQFPRP